MLTDEFLEQAVETAREAAMAAGKVIHRFYRQPIEVHLKSDQSPVTQADVEAETVIKQHLRERFPDHAFFGEESGCEGNSDFLWLIDPIDGTKSFIRNYPMFSTQIALMYQDELVVGVSYASEFGEMAWARRGGGAVLNGEKIHVSQTKEFGPHTAISLGNIKTLAQGLGWNALAKLIQCAGRTRGYGDFYHYHLLARGSVDLVIESDVNILDIAALAVIVREAGGVFTDLKGNSVDLHTTSVLAGTQTLHSLALTHFQA